MPPSSRILLSDYEKDDNDDPQLSSSPVDQVMETVDSVSPRSTCGEGIESCPDKDNKAEDNRLLGETTLRTKNKHDRDDDVEVCGTCQIEIVEKNLSSPEHQESSVTCHEPKVIVPDGSDPHAVSTYTTGANSHNENSLVDGNIVDSQLQESFQSSHRQFGILSQDDDDDDDDDDDAGREKLAVLALDQVLEHADVFAGNPKMLQLNTSTDKQRDGSNGPSILVEENSFDSPENSGEMSSSVYGENICYFPNTTTTTSPRLQANEIGMGDPDMSKSTIPSVGKSKNLLRKSDQSRIKSPCSSYSINHESLAVDNESLQMFASGEQCSPCSINHEGVAVDNESLRIFASEEPLELNKSIVNDTLRQVEAVNNCHWTDPGADFAGITTMPADSMNVGNFEDKHSDKINGQCYSIAQDISMSNNSPFADDPDSSLSAQEQVDQINNVLATAPAENSQQGENPVGQDTSSPGEHGEDNNQEVALQDNHASSGSYLLKNVPYDSINPVSYCSVHVADDDEKVSAVDDSSSRKCYGKFDETEISFLKGALGEALKIQREQESNNDHTFSSSVSSTTTVNSSNGLKISRSLEINSAEFDFGSVVPRCKGFVVSSKDRTEADAQALLTHIMNGDPDPCLAPDGFVPMLNVEKKSECNSESVSSTGFEQSNEERDATRHNTASTGGDVTIPIFGQNILYNTQGELSERSIEEKITVVVEKKQTDVEEVCGKDTLSSLHPSTAVSVDEKDAHDSNEKGENSNYLSNDAGDNDVGQDCGNHDMATEQGADVANLNEDRTRHMGDEASDATRNADFRADEGYEEKKEIECWDHKSANYVQCRSLEDLSSKLNMTELSEEDLRRYENSNVIYNTVTIGKNESATRLLEKEGNLVPSLDDFQTQKDNLSQKSEIKFEKSAHDCGGKILEESLHRKVEPSQELLELSPEYNSGSICPCNSEIYATEASKYLIKPIMLSHDKRNAMYNDTIKRTTNSLNCNVSKTGAPFVPRSPYNSGTLLPVIEKKQLCRKMPNKIPKRQTLITNNFGSKGETSAQCTSLKTEARNPNLFGMKSPHYLNPTSLRKPQILSSAAIPANLIHSQNFPQAKPTPQARGRRQIARAGVSVSHQFKPTKNNQLRSVTTSVIPQNVNANKMNKGSSISAMAESCTAVDSLTSGVCRSPSPTSSTSSSSCTNSSMFPDVLGASNEDVRKKKQHNARSSRLIPTEASSQITNDFKDGGKALFPGEFNRYLRRPRTEPTKLYAPKKHLKPGTTPAEEYHKYKMDLRLCQSLAKIKRGPPTVDCYLDPRLNRRKARSRSSSHRRDQLNSFGPLDDKHFPAKVSSSSLRWS